jgi:hypothetical protein
MDRNLSFKAQPFNLRLELKRGKDNSFLWAALSQKILESSLEIRKILRRNILTLITNKHIMREKTEVLCFLLWNQNHKQSLNQTRHKIGKILLKLRIHWDILKIQRIEVFHKRNLQWIFQPQIQVLHRIFGLAHKSRRESTLK